MTAFSAPQLRQLSACAHLPHHSDFDSDSEGGGALIDHKRNFRDLIYALAVEGDGRAAARLMVERSKDGGAQCADVDAFCDAFEARPLDIVVASSPPSVH